jgi:uncharacterized protein YbjT (DUF2867 family)
MTTLVTGGTGNIGRLVVQGLLDRGEHVRVLSRQASPAGLAPGAESAIGDLTDPSLDARVFADVDRVFLFPATQDLAGFLHQARDVEHVVVLSSLAAAGERERDRTSVTGKHHVAVEAAVQASGIPATILRPGSFANNLLFWAHAIRTTDGVDGPYPTSAQAPVHEADVADVAVTALTEPGHDGAIYPLTGPQALSQTDQLAAIATALGRTLTYRTISPEQYSAMMSQWMDPAIVAMLLRYWSETVDRPDTVHSSASITRRARTLAQWASDHVDDFR